LVLVGCSSYRPEQQQSGQQNFPGTAQLQEITSDLPEGYFEIRGLSAGAFTPSYWQKNTLNWVPDVRAPMLAAQTTSPYQNIYAPWALEQPNGWRLFYGGWDGSDTQNDRIYSVTTNDFLSFGNHALVIDHGDFVHVNNENVQQLADGSLHMICTAAPDALNKPAYFSSPDGTTWNGSPEPYEAKLTDIISIDAYSGFSVGNFNGANVLLQDNGTWVLYFKDWAHLDATYWASSVSPPSFQFQGVAQKGNNFVNDVKKITVGNQSWYVMGFVEIDPKQTVTYSLSNDGRNFPAEQFLFKNISGQDLYIVAIGFVLKGNQLLGVLYGASAVETLDQNQIFARWLQKKVVIQDDAGTHQNSIGSHGPDRQWFQVPASGTLQGVISLYAEDGVTPLAKGSFSVSSGKAYELVVN